jgi:predicted amidohydrolase YtcJ
MTVVDEDRIDRRGANMTADYKNRVNLSRRAALALGAGALLAPRATASAEPRGLLITGGPIYTGLGDGARVEAVVTRGDRIIFTGELADARAVSSGARHIDLGGAAAFPGFTDCHCHLTEVGLALLTLDLVGTGSLAELQARLKAWAAEHPSGPIIGRGWIETHWPEHRFPTRADLDAAVSDRPVLLERADGHAVVVNSKTLQVAGIGASTPNPAGGEYLRDAAGAPNGMVIDNALGSVWRVFPNPDKATRLEANTRADKLYRSRGWTGVHHMSVSQDNLNILRAMAARGALGLRVDNYMDVDSAEEVFATGPTADPTGRVRLRGIKLYADGALGSRGAALLAPYSDRPDSTGLVRTPHDAMVGYMGKAKAVNAQVAVHAIGDRGNRNTLDAMAEVLGAGHTDRRWRIEHAQILALDDIPRFAAMGVTASMQTSHAIGDLYFAPARLGDERLKGAYAWRSLLDTGALVCGGTDAPVEKGDPLIEFYAAVYRHALNGFSAPDWGLDQVLSRSQALALYTSSAARAVGRENDLGTLEVGKRADLTVFSKDLMTVEPPEILKAKAVMTVSDGRVMFEG